MDPFGCSTHPGGLTLSTNSDNHLCADCHYEFPTCTAVQIVFGIDRDPSTLGADADKILECVTYKPRHV
jgi:hypothetical protein